MSITKIDGNFILQNVKESNANWIEIPNDNVLLSGVFYDEESKLFLRMPTEISTKVSKSVFELSKQTSGGRICFKTDSDYIALQATISKSWFMNHMTTIGANGFSLYADGVFNGIFTPDTLKMATSKDDFFTFDGIIRFSTKKEREIVIYFPLYNSVIQLSIGIQNTSFIIKGEKQNKQLLFYGSSITQGGCASRPGNDYSALLSRWLNVDYMNLGFSGNGLAEPLMVKYLASLSPNMYIMDYDYNAPTVEYLQSTHLPLYLGIRKEKKEIPIIFISRPNYEYDIINNEQRRQIIKNTYLYAKEHGDNNVEFVNGELLYGDFGRDGCSVDTIHPNDLGFYKMATYLLEIVKKYI